MIIWMKEMNNKQLMKPFYGTWREEARTENPLIQPTCSWKNSIINGPTTQENKEKKNIPLNLQEDIITILIVMILFLHAEIN